MVFFIFKSKIRGHPGKRDYASPQRGFSHCFRLAHSQSTVMDVAFYEKKSASRFYHTRCAVISSRFVKLWSRDVLFGYVKLELVLQIFKTILWDLKNVILIMFLHANLSLSGWFWDSESEIRHTEIKFIITFSDRHRIQCMKLDGLRMHVLRTIYNAACDRNLYYSDFTVPQ